MSGILLFGGATLPPLNIDVPGVESRVHPLKHSELGEIMAHQLSKISSYGFAFSLSQIRSATRVDRQTAMGFVLLSWRSKILMISTPPSHSYRFTFVLLEFVGGIKGSRRASQKHLKRLNCAKIALSRDPTTSPRPPFYG
jgi:hypothetical protein